MKYFYLMSAIVAMLLLAAPVSAQQYGVGIGVYVPYVAPGTLQLDGNASEGAWANATVVDLTQNWSGDWSGHPYPDVTATAKLLWTDDTLYVYAEIQDYEPFYWGNADSSSPWGGEQILIGVDDTHAKDDTMSGGWEGWPENAPDKGPTCYKIWMDDITLNWGQLNFSPRWDSGWTPGTIFVDNVNFKWGVEMGIYLPHAHDGGKIGFNIGGASADSAWADSNDWNGDGAYGWFSWQSVEYAGGDVQYNSASFGTLLLTQQHPYGTKVNMDVPYVAPGTLQLDGNANEGVWANATVVDLTKNWSGDWSGHPYPDVTATAKLLWTNDTLFVYAEMQDYEPFYWGNADSSSPWGGEQFLIGVDDTHAKDDTMSGGWEGWPENAPDKGPTCYKVWMDDITLNWGQLGFSPRWDSGWTPGTIFVDNVNYKWGVEMGIYLPHVHDGAEIGFNIGGASADSAWADSNDWNGDGAYGWFSWQSVEYAGGDVQYNSASFATLTMAPVPMGSQMSAGWNLISLGVSPADLRTRTLYPSAVSKAFAYEGGYVEKDNLECGTGYWLKFSGPEIVTVHGIPVKVDTFDVTKGWNMIGSIGTPVSTGSIVSDPGGMTTSNFFAYNGSYIVTDSIRPGVGYWVKVSEAGKLIVGTAGAAAPKASRIHIVPDNEMPPPPPKDVAAETPALPAVFSLSQNYPNPFNPSTVVKYTLPVDAKVEVRIFNMLGQEVRTLVDEVQGAGYHSTVWNSTNNGGRPLGSGVYFYRMTARATADVTKSFTEVRKMLLMK